MRLVREKNALKLVLDIGKIDTKIYLNYLEMHDIDF
jgi:hypothetical protein